MFIHSVVMMIGPWFCNNTVGSHFTLGLRS